MRIVLAAALGVLMLAPAANAKTVSLPYSDDFLAIAYGGGHALVAEHEPFGAKAVVIRDLDFAARTDHVLLEVPYSAAETPDVALAANGSAYLVAVGPHVVMGGYDSSQRPVLDCASTTPRIAAGTQGFALAGCLPTGAVTVAADGTVTPTGLTAAADALAYTEPFLAVQSGGEATVRDVTTGAERRVADGEADSIAVAADGTLLKSTVDGLFAWPPGAVEPSVLFTRPAGGAGVVAGRAVFDTFTAPRLVPLGGGIARTISTPGAGLTSLLGFDGTRAAFQSFSCAGARQVTLVDVDAPRPAGEVSGCPVRIAAFGLRFPRSGKASVRIACPNGCRARVALIEQSTEQRPCGALDDTGKRRCRTIATAQLNLAASPGRRRVAFRLTATGRRLRGRTVDVGTEVDRYGLTFLGDIRRAVL